MLKANLKGIQLIPRNLTVHQNKVRHYLKVYSKIQHPKHRIHKPIKNYQHAKNQENMTYNQKNQSIEIDPEMMELTNKDVKAAVINTF